MSYKMNVKGELSYLFSPNVKTTKHIFMLSIFKSKWYTNFFHIM